MKTRLITLLILGIYFLQAINAQPQKIQLAPAANQTYTQAVEQTMQQLNISRIPYATLYDKVAGWSNLDNWTNTDTTSYAHIKQAWLDVENSRMIAAPETYTAMQSGVQSYLNQNYIPLISIFSGFGSIDTLSFYDGRMRIENNQLIDNGLASPYFTKKVGVAGFAKEKVLANTAYSLVSSPVFRLSNETASVLLYYVVQNLTSGNSVTFSKDNTAAINFTVTGINLLKIQTVTSTGTYSNYQKNNRAA